MSKKNKFLKLSEEKQSPVYFFADFENRELVQEVNLEGEEKGDMDKIYDVPIFREGSFDHYWYGELKFDVDYLSKMIENFNKKVTSTDISFDQDHMPSLGALAWVEPNGLSIKSKVVNTATGQRAVNILYAKIKLTPEGYEKIIEKKMFRYFSSEVSSNYSTNEFEPGEEGSRDVKYWGPTLVGGGFTNRPFISHLGSAFNMFSTSQEELEEAGVELNVRREMMSENDVNLAFGSMAFSKSQKIENKVENQTTHQQDDGAEVGLPEKVEPQEFSNKPLNEEKKMKFSEFLELIKKAQSSNERVEIASKHKFSDEEQESMRLHLIATEEASIQASRLAEELSRQVEAEKERAKALADQNVELSRRVLEAGEQSYKHRVKAFSSKLHQENHTPAFVNVVEEFLLSIKADERKFSFSLNEDKVDLMTVLDMLFSKLPTEARVPEESDIVQTAPEVETPEEPVELSETEKRIAAYEQRYNQKPGSDIVDFIREDGSIDIGKLV